MKQVSELQPFYQSLNEVALVNHDLDHQRDKLKHIVDAYCEKVQAISVDPSLSKQNKDLSNMLDLATSSIKQSACQWAQTFDAMLQQEKFNSDLENNFIVIIYGKVKAGKSSLGNFIAQQSPDPEGVVIFKYDEAGQEKSIQKLEEIDANHFATDNLECTSAIQGFKLNGMAWIDTPGLGSMVKENGALAKKYIDSADYIIYPISSDTPLQADEIQQLEELFQQKKRVTICITKSDEMKKKKGEDGQYIRENGRIVKFPVNKSKERRQSQEDYIHTEIASINKNESLLGDILSISVHAAKAGIEQDNADLFEGSHISQFYALLTDVVKNKAMQLKEDAPVHRLITFIDRDILGADERPHSINNVRKNIHSLEHETDKLNEKLSLLIENTESDIYQEVHDTVENYYSIITQSNASEIFQRIHREIGDAVDKMIEANMTELFEGFDQHLNTFATEISLSDFKIHDRYETYHYTTKTRNKSVGSALLGGALAIGAGILTGGASVPLTIAITTAAGGTGAYLGGKLGSATGSTHTGKVHVGDNKTEVVQQFKESEIKIYSEHCQQVYQKIQNYFFHPVQAYIGEMERDLELFEATVQSFKEEL